MGSAVQLAPTQPQGLLSLLADARSQGHILHHDIVG